MEMWKDIKFWVPRSEYIISSYGQIARRSPFEIVEPHLSDKYEIGEYVITLHDSVNDTDSDHLLAPLVLMTFKPQGRHFGHWRHLDGNKRNNRLDNLKWTKYPSQ